MKAGTATKMTLNMITTGAMIRWGKVHDNLMVDLVASNQKLHRRALGLVATLAGVGEDEARQFLHQAGGEVKTAVLISRQGIPQEEAREKLERHGGVLRLALEEGGKR